MIVVYKYNGVDKNKTYFCGKKVEDIPQNIIPNFKIYETKNCFQNRDADGYICGYAYYNTSDFVIIDTEIIHEHSPKRILDFMNIEYKEYQKQLRQQKLERLLDEDF